MTLVYILSEYEEHGAEKVTATLDRSCLMNVIDQNWPYQEKEGEWKGQRQIYKDWITEAKDHLKVLLQKSDEELVGGGWECHDGWGGMQLHVIELV